MARDAIEFINNEAAQRFEGRVDGATAILQYRRTGDRIVYIHTEVPHVLEDRGIASALARTALDFARAQHLDVVPLCPLVRGYIEEHPEYQALVRSTERERMS